MKIDACGVAALFVPKAKGKCYRFLHTAVQ